MSAIRFLLVCTLAASFVACGGNDDGNNNQNQGDSDQTGGDDNGGDPIGGDTVNPAQPLTQTELCVLFVSAIATAETGYCSTAAVTIPQSVVDHCGQTNSGSDIFATYGNQWAQLVLDSSSHNRVSFDWTKARSCTTKARALRAAHKPYELETNADWAALTTGSGDCATFYSGLANTGDTCVNAFDCKTSSDFCGQDAPYTAATFTCRPYRNLGDTCDSDRMPCKEGLECDNTNHCVAECLDDGDCSTYETCVAGACQGPDLALGAQCDDSSQCKDDCAVCNQLGSEAHATCKLVGGMGAPCATNNDCANDLACTSANTCGNIAVGQACVFGGDVCANGSSCVRTVDCSGLSSEATCNSYGTSCSWNGAACEDGSTGTCASYPTSGACLPDSNSQRCAGGYYCNGGTCVAECGEPTVCGSGQYCNTTSHPYTCAAALTDDCTSSTQCGTDKFCALPEQACAEHGDSSSCEADADCDYTGGACQPASGAHSHCLAKRAVGQSTYGTCTVDPDSGGSAEACISDTCYRSGSDAPVCANAAKGCLDAAQFIPIAFAFGLVRVARRRKQKAES